MAGIARENVSRILNDWKRRKLVSRLSGYYCLENKAALERDCPWHLVPDPELAFAAPITPEEARLLDLLDPTGKYRQRAG